MEFQRGYQQMDLASACVLRPLNHWVLYFKMDGLTGERAEVQGIPDRSLAEEAATRGGVVLMASGNYGTGHRRVT